MARSPCRAVVTVLLAVLSAACGSREVTYVRDVAPILHARCVPCHQEGQVAPFSLMDYAGARKHASQIVDVTSRRIMPPWMPEPGHGHFKGERLLEPRELRILARWAEAGAPEGDGTAPDPPPAAEGWSLGQPDLVLELDRPYVLAAAGPDVYRNFVLPTNLSSTRFVRASELRPGNRHVAHHASVLLDPTNASRRRDAEDDAPGYDGIHGAEGTMSVPGFFIGWTPGRRPDPGRNDLAWALERGTDIVIQLHMQRSGREETVRPSLGLWFASGPPRLRPHLAFLGTQRLDIPAGERAYVVEDHMDLVSDADLLAILPHTHFLGREITATAILPGGERKDLLIIRNWDFNWQEAYTYEKPIHLPRGTRVDARFVYDNSEDNEWNPHDPPARVTFGLSSSDEMCALWLQLLPTNPQDLPAFESATGRRLIEAMAEGLPGQIEREPRNAQLRVQQGQALMGQGRDDEALAAFMEATRLDEALPDPFFYGGLVFERKGNLPGAEQVYRQYIQLGGDEAMAQVALGRVYLSANQPNDARDCYLRAIQVDPDDFEARWQLGSLLARMGDARGAAGQLQECLAIRPQHAEARRLLQQIEVNALRR